MSAPRYLRLYDPAAQPSSWNERMVPGEFAVHFSGAHPGPPGTCAVLTSLVEAEAYATEQVGVHPGLGCRIYDHHGMVGAPLRKIQGPEYKDNTGLSAPVRRWLGLGLLLLGFALFAVDWRSGFTRMWPSTIGLPLLLPGAVLVFMEALVVLTAKRRAKAAGTTAPR